MVESKVQEFKTVEDFTAAFDKATETGDKFIVYLTGELNISNADGSFNSWCPDCDVARPSIATYLDKNTTRTVVKALVQTKEEWVGNASHPYKAHPLIKAGGVPGMLLFEGKNVLHRVEDLDDFKNEGLMQMFFED